MAEYRSKDKGNLTEADQKFFALRESGYTGPIDQDGNAVESGLIAETLHSLRDCSGAVDAFGTVHSDADPGL